MNKKDILLILVASEYFLSDKLEAEAGVARGALAAEYGIIDLYGEAKKEGISTSFDLIGRDAMGNEG